MPLCSQPTTDRGTLALLSAFLSLNPMALMLLTGLKDATEDNANLWLLPQVQADRSKCLGTGLEPIPGSAADCGYLLGTGCIVSMKSGESLN